MLALAWRNIWRQTRRSFITISAMAFGAAVCMPMMAFMDGVYATMFDVAVTQQTGHVRVEHPDYPKTNSMFDSVGDARATLTALEGIPGASAVTWRAYGAGLLGSDQKSTGAVLVGVDPVRERGLANTEAIVRSGTWLTAPGQILLGHRLAADIQAELGSEIVIMTQAADGSIGAGTYTVAGLVRSGNIMRDTQGAWLSLADLQELLYLDDQVHELVLLAEGGRDNVDALTAAVKAEVGDDALVRSWVEANPQMAEMLEAGSGADDHPALDRLLSGRIWRPEHDADERVRAHSELGVMMALGTRPSAVVRLILMEGFLLGLGRHRGGHHGRHHRLLAVHTGPHPRLRRDGVQRRGVSGHDEGRVRHRPSPAGDWLDDGHLGARCLVAGVAGLAPAAGRCDEV